MVSNPLSLLHYMWISWDILLALFGNSVLALNPLANHEFPDEHVVIIGGGVPIFRRTHWFMPLGLLHSWVYSGIQWDIPICRLLSCGPFSLFIYRLQRWSLSTATLKYQGVDMIFIEDTAICRGENLSGTTYWLGLLISFWVEWYSILQADGDIAGPNGDATGLPRESSANGRYFSREWLKNAAGK